MQPVQQNIPVRVRATKGFYAHVQGQYGVVNPDSVVDLPRELAAMMVSANKATLVDPSTQLLRAEAKPRPSVVDPSIERLDRLQASVERLAEVVAQLVAAGASKSAKDK